MRDALAAAREEEAASRQRVEENAIVVAERVGRELVKMVFSATQLTRSRRRGRGRHRRARRCGWIADPRTPARRRCRRSRPRLPAWAKGAVPWLAGLTLAVLYLLYRTFVVDIRAGSGCEAADDPKESFDEDRIGGIALLRGGSLRGVAQGEGVEFSSVVVPAADDRLALAASAAGVPVHVLENPKMVPGDAVPKGTDLVVAAHTHARVSDEALAHSRLGGIGYHPSLLPRHRGIAAVEWTIQEGDPIAGGSVYHLADGWDAGAIAAQEWCFVGKGETARELWERALAPIGLELLAKVVRYAKEHGHVPSKPQDPRFATKAPMIKKPAS